MQKIYGQKAEVTKEGVAYLKRYTLPDPVIQEKFLHPNDYLTYFKGKSNKKPSKVPSALRSPSPAWLPLFVAIHPLGQEWTVHLFSRKCSSYARQSRSGAANRNDVDYHSSSPSSARAVSAQKLKKRAPRNAFLHPVSTKIKPILPQYCTTTTASNK